MYGKDVKIYFSKHSGASSEVDGRTNILSVKTNYQIKLRIVTNKVIFRCVFYD